jgi:hypothetical protein
MTKTRAEALALPQRPLALVTQRTGLPCAQRPIPQRPRCPVTAGPMGRLQLRQTGKNLTAGHCLFGTAEIRTRTSGGVRAGGVNAPRYSIRHSCFSFRGSIRASSKWDLLRSIFGLHLSDLVRLSGLIICNPLADLMPTFEMT